MQETEEIFSLNLSSGNRVVSQNPEISRGLVAPYQQQAHDINSMLQNQMTRELYNQFKLLEERAVFCMKGKDKALEEVTRKNREMEICLRKALAEAEYWKKLSDQKTALCKDLATRLLKVRRRENSMNMIGERKKEEDAASSIGENGEDCVGTARTRRSKRRRV